MNDYTYTQTDYNPMAYQQASPMGQFFYLLITVYFIIAGWKIFEKAGEAGWKVLIPFYNTYTMLRIARKPGWWLLLFFIPVVNIIIAFIVALALGKAFGKDAVWSIFLLFFLPFIGVSILAFSKNAKYKKPTKK